MTERDILHDVVRIAYNAQHGIKETQRPPDMVALLKMAEKQNVYPLVYYGVGELCDEQKDYKLFNRKLVATYYVRKKAYLDVIAEMETAGIQTIILKGYSCSSKYQAEYLRVSSDCDLFVLSDDEEAAQHILERNGFLCKEVRQEHQHHSTWTHTDVGICELHTKLVEDEIEYVWESTFVENELINHRIRVDTEEGYYYRLPPVEEWVFLFVHTLKHFLQTGLSVQMLLDLYASYNSMEGKHTEKALQMIETSRFGSLWKVFYEYIHKYGAGQKDVEQEEAMELITEDLLRSGWLGLKENTCRVSLYDVANKRELSVHTWLYRVKTMYCRVFPERKKMEELFPTVVNKTWLLPSLYVYRLVGKIMQFARKSERTKMDDQMRKKAKAERIQYITRIMNASKT